MQGEELWNKHIRASGLNALYRAEMSLNNTQSNEQMQMIRMN